MDTGPESQLALRWATDEAARRELPVHVVTAYEWPVASLNANAPVYFESPDEARRVFDEAVAFVRDRLGADRVTGSSPVSARPAEVLVRESVGAELLVVGSRCRSTMASVVLGSVSCAVAAHAKCPVVVVRNVRGTDPQDRVVVGADGSERSELALEFGFEVAALHGWKLDVVYAWQPVEALDPATWTLEKAEAGRAARRKNLRERIEPYLAKYPAVDATTYVIEGRPNTVLYGQSRTARLIVVGTRGHGGVAGLLLGSVSQGLLHHAHCSVAVVRPDGRRE
ncbi:universal stress protein [Flindersiella endophytica]